MRGIYINDRTQPFTAQILDGLKTIETRLKPTLDRFVGERVGIIRSGKGRRSIVVGYATLGPRKNYDTRAEFRADESRHLVLPGSKFAEGKCGYPLSDVTREANPFPVLLPKDRQHALITL